MMAWSWACLTQSRLERHTAGVVPCKIRCCCGFFFEKPRCVARDDSARDCSAWSQRCLGTRRKADAVRCSFPVGSKAQNPASCPSWWRHFPAAESVVDHSAAYLFSVPCKIMRTLQIPSKKFHENCQSIPCNNRERHFFKRKTPSCTSDSQHLLETGMSCCRGTTQTHLQDRQMVFGRAWRQWARFRGVFDQSFFAVINWVWVGVLSETKQTEQTWPRLASACTTSCSLLCSEGKTTQIEAEHVEVETLSWQEQDFGRVSIAAAICVPSCPVLCSERGNSRCKYRYQ